MAASAKTKQNQYARFLGEYPFDNLRRMRFLYQAGCVKNEESNNKLALLSLKVKTNNKQNEYLM